ncbi:MAG: hypothetical protein AB7E10_02460 [Burkholderiaceae bacterium]|jgi:hypothetical protein
MNVSLVAVVVDENTEWLHEAAKVFALFAVLDSLRVPQPGPF